jgi:hypothetical protein
MILDELNLLNKKSANGRWLNEELDKNVSKIRLFYISYYIVMMKRSDEMMQVSFSLTRILG